MKGEISMAKSKEDSKNKIKPIGADGHRERMFKRLIASDTLEISPRDTLEMLLYYPIRMRDTRDAAVDLMDKFEGDFYRVLSAPENELIKTKGIGPSAANFLNLVGDIVKRTDVSLSDEAAIPSLVPRIAGLFDSLRDEIKGDELWAVFLNTRSEIVGTAKIRTDFSIPTENEAYLILQKAHRCHSSFLVLAHVTGGLEIYPTAKDNQLFKLMKDTFEVTNLTLLAYYMVGGDEIMSIQYSGIPEA